MREKKMVIGLMLFVFMGGLLGCATGTSSPPAATISTLKMASVEDLPEYAQKAKPDVREPYRFAAANPEILKKIPCYCGCVSLQHKDLYDCYVKDVQADGTIVFNKHAYLWMTCNAITRDVMEMMEEGKPLAEIRQFVDEEYKEAGKPTPTEKPI